MNEKIHRRKNLYVSNAIQGRLLRRLAIYWVFYHVVLWQLHRDRILQDETFQNSMQHPYVENEAEIVDGALVAAE